jgi:3-hydroxyanthranilate 3,4-dioxygenase
MPIVPLPIDLPRWLKENSDRLKPPVNNFCLFSGADFVVMVVGGPNARADYHINETEVSKGLEYGVSLGLNFFLLRTGMVLST